MIKIFVVSRNSFKEYLKNNNINDQNVEDLKDVAFISIRDFSDSEWGRPLFQSNKSNVLNLQFDDVEIDGEGSPTNPSNKTKGFSKEQGLEVLDFLHSIKDKKVLIAHCAAGISRSGAVGQFALGYLNGDREHFHKYNSHILPNGRVLRILHNIANGYE